MGMLEMPENMDILENLRRPRVMLAELLLTLGIVLTFRISDVYNQWV